MKSKYRYLLRNVLLGIYLVSLLSMGFPSRVSAATSTALCYTMTPSLTDAAYKYLDEIYSDKYPQMALRCKYGTAEDKAILKTLSDMIVEDGSSNSKKTSAVIEWCLDNIKYDVNSSAYPMSVFFSRKASCLGYAGLIAELLRQQGIPAVVADGWRGDMKNLKHRDLYTTLIADGHAWLFAYLNGKWVMFDPLFNGSSPLTDRNYISTWYYFGTIEGIAVTYPGMDLALAGGGIAYVYKDGRFIDMDQGKPFTGNTNLFINDLSMAVTAYTEYCGYEYLDPSRRTEQMVEGEVFRGGWFSYGGASLEYAYENGIKANGTFLSHQGKNYYFSQGLSYLILAPENSCWIEHGYFTVPVGFAGKALLPSFVEEYIDDPAYQVTFKEASFSSPNVGSISSDGTFTAASAGMFVVEYAARNIESGSLHSSGCFDIYVSKGKPVPDYTYHKVEEPETLPKEDIPQKTRLKAGSTFKDTSSNGQYKVLKDNLTVEFTGMIKQRSSLAIPSAVQHDGFSYKVVSIASGACRGNKKLKKLEIGKHIKRIKEKAFFGCTKLRRITILSKKLKASTVGANAFGKGYKKAVVITPKECVKKYRKILLQKGMSKKAVFR